MASSKESKGFIQTEWVCPNCNSRNPGPQKTCDSCGAPQPANVQFYLPAEAKVIQADTTVLTATANYPIDLALTPRDKRVLADTMRIRVSAPDVGLDVQLCAAQLDRLL